MTAGPRSPGRAPPVHQPATSKRFGTSSAPCGSSPNRTSGASTWIEGITTRTGSETRDGTLVGVAVGAAAIKAGGGPGTSGSPDSAAPQPTVSAAATATTAGR